VDRISALGLLIGILAIVGVRPLEGGLDAWRERKYPVERRVNIELGG
jgi:rhodanese-related sulfurtransferase